MQAPYLGGSGLDLRIAYELSLEGYPCAVGPLSRILENTYVPEGVEDFGGGTYLYALLAVGLRLVYASTYLLDGRRYVGVCLQLDNASVKGVGLPLGSLELREGLGTPAQPKGRLVGLPGEVGSALAGLIERPDERGTVERESCLYPACVEAQWLTPFLEALTDKKEKRLLAAVGDAEGHQLLGARHHIAPGGGGEAGVSHRVVSAGALVIISSIVCARRVAFGVPCFGLLGLLPFDIALHEDLVLPPLHLQHVAGAYV